MQDQATQSIEKNVTEALNEIRGLYERAAKSQSLKSWTVSNATDRLTGFRKHYYARITANKAIGSEFELRSQLIEDLKKWLHALVALKDYVEAAQSKSSQQISLKEAMNQYNRRATALGAFLTNLLGTHEPLTVTQTFTEAQSELVKLIRKKSEREIFQIVSRVVPAPQEIDEQISSLFSVLIRKAHQAEPAIQQLTTPKNTLLNDLDAELLRTFANSQELRDFVAPYMAALLKKALRPMPEVGGEPPVEAFDDAFRNTYFAVVNRVIHYYREHPGAELVAKAPAQQSSKSGVGQAEKSDQRDPRSGAVVTNDLPVKDDVKRKTSIATPTVPLITEDQIETAELLDDGKTVDIDTTAKRGKGSVSGTGLS